MSKVILCLSYNSSPSLQVYNINNEKETDFKNFYNIGTSKVFNKESIEILKQKIVKKTDEKFTYYSKNVAAALDLLWVVFLSEFTFPNDIKTFTKKHIWTWGDKDDLSLS